MERLRRSPQPCQPQGPTPDGSLAARPAADVTAASFGQEAYARRPPSRSALGPGGPFPAPPLSPAPGGGVAPPQRGEENKGALDRGRPPPLELREPLPEHRPAM